MPAAANEKLARGIYEDKTGRAGIIHVGRPIEFRFPPFTPIAAIRDRLDAERKKRHGSGRAGARRGTLADAVDRWDSQRRTWRAGRNGGPNSARG